MIIGYTSHTKFDSTIAAKLTQAAESVRMTLRDYIILVDEQYKQMGHDLIFFIVQMGATGLPRYTFDFLLTQPSYQMLLVS